MKVNEERKEKKSAEIGRYLPIMYLLIKMALSSRNVTRIEYDKRIAIH